MTIPARATPSAREAISGAIDLGGTPPNHRLAQGLRLTAWSRWLITCAAMVVSTYALDIAATLAGVSAVASGVAAGLDLSHALAILAASYVLWGAGLHVNLAANLALLEQTGTSTNVLSKAAYDFALKMRWSPRARQWAAGTGYVLTELAKEAPYYAAAFSAAAFTESVSAQEAVVFLAGANLGAAAYEYALALLVRAYLAKRVPPAYASFETDWEPRDYLENYYSAVEPDERHTIAFFVDALKRTAAGEPVLFFGVGPALHHVFLAANHASEIHLGDYLPANLREIERWIERDAYAHDWSPFVRYTLECEGVDRPDGADIARREEMTRAKVQKMLAVDLRDSNPLGGVDRVRYHTVISAYCADSATGDRQVWAAYMRRLAGLVRPGGTLLLAALRRSCGYAIGDKTFPCANIDENDIRAVLAPFAGSEHMTIEVCELDDAPSHGYSSIVLASARFRNRCG
jgi:NNMT/PNMT/TEMT family